MLLHGDGSSRIVNGQTTQIENHPWQISLRYNGNHICGGSILSSNSILTAAHCLGDNPAIYSILAGSSSRTSTTVGQIRNATIDPKEKHKEYNSPPGGYPNDIAILLLSEELVLNGDSVKAVSLPGSSFNPDSSNNCVMSGWGRTNRGTGDSGGPYVCKNGNEDVLTGVTSWGIQSGDKCLTSYPSVYVRVSEFLNWINQHME
ncbi:hypothetical protein KUTeg_009070 [Tegillarca granosa]|uniref:Peptidase S1 domain-containing protein n=1 Tax=Tegillarca granosa TaxID=220873 RepID=A0ABQ9FCK1_TEGGR|nr:hypothetical protein KUTeg_009070 [Tegillarca granosa]